MAQCNGISTSRDGSDRTPLTARTLHRRHNGTPWLHRVYFPWPGRGDASSVRFSVDGQQSVRNSTVARWDATVDRFGRNSLWRRPLRTLSPFWVASFCLARAVLTFVPNKDVDSSTSLAVRRPVDRSFYLPVNAPRPLLPTLYRVFTWFPFVPSKRIVLPHDRTSFTRFSCVLPGFIGFH